MTTYTIFSDASDGQISSNNASYATARSGGSLVATTNGTSFTTGQVADFTCYEIFIGWDTSAINDAETVSSATISLYGSVNQSTTDFTMNVRDFNWGSTLTTADWIAGASLSGNTLLATFDTTGYATTGYNDFTSQAAILTSVSKTAFTYVVVSSSRHEGNNQPSGNEFVQAWAADQAGTTNDPKIVVVADAPAGTKFRMMLTGVGY